MEEAKQVRFKIFLWDQFIRPIYLLLNLYQLQALLIALLILNFVTWKNVTAFWVLVISLAVIFIYQIIKYYKSGEFMHNYRKYKSEKGEYGDYRKVAKILKKEKEYEQTKEGINIIEKQKRDEDSDEEIHQDKSAILDELNSGEAFHE